MRGAALLEVGGTMVYSTCSLNPIENEAVVAEMLRRCGGALELCDGAADVAAQLAGGCAPGMESWTLLDFRLQRHGDWAALQASAAVPAGEKRMYMASMWPPTPQEASRLRLRHCVRLLPHRSDSGGFFVAKLRKVRPLPLHPAPTWPRTEEQDASTAAPGQGGAEHRYKPLPRDVLTRVAPLLARQPGKKDKKHKTKDEKRKRARDDERQLPCDAAEAAAPRLFARSRRASRIVYLSPTASHCCVGEGSRLRVVFAGATVLRRAKRRRRVAGGVEDGTGADDLAPAYRVTAEGEVLL